MNAWCDTTRVCGIKILRDVQQHLVPQLRFGSRLPLYSKIRIEMLTTELPLMYTIVITFQIESGFVSGNDSIPFDYSAIPSSATPFRMEGESGF
ncbi:hypothetical protein TNCV_3343561 [Trichonephila clavipes]|nr:hypothetical protein TNCV_3343561 [Trichonephila clavipes]